MIEQFPDETPPEGAEPMEGDFYRLVSKLLKPGDQTDETSWLRPYQTRKNRFYGQPELPEAHGLSVFAGLDDLHTCRNFNAFMRMKSVARVTIGLSDGHLLHTPIEGGVTHHDWWTTPYDLVPDAEVIEGIEEEPDGL